MTFTGAGSLSPKRRKVGERRVVLVDIENVVGGSAAVRDNVAWARAAVEETARTRPDDHVVIGVGPAGLMDVGCVWARVRYVVRSGLDVADLALLDVLGENIADRYAEVVLVSGDGIFAGAIAALASRGVRTTVVAHADGLSRQLEIAADAVRFLPDRPAPRPALALVAKDVA